MLDAELDRNHSAVTSAVMRCVAIRCDATEDWVVDLMTATFQDEIDLMLRFLKGNQSQVQSAASTADERVRLASSGTINVWPLKASVKGHSCYSYPPAYVIASILRFVNILALVAGFTFDR